MDVSNIAKWLVLFGLAIMFLGGIFWGVGKLGIPLGKLPGDFFYKGENFSIWVPIATTIILSLFLTIVINFLLLFFRK
jgi:hypothetical protein